MHRNFSWHFVGCKELKTVICWICNIRLLYLLKRDAIPMKNILTGQVTFQHMTSYFCTSCISWTWELLDSFRFNFSLGCPHGLPELLFGCKLPPSLIINLLLQRFSMGLMGATNRLLSFFCPQQPIMRSNFLRHKIVMHEDDCFLTSVLCFVASNKLVSQKLHIVFRGYFHTFKDQLVSWLCC